MPRALAILNCGQIVTLAGPARPRVGPEMRNVSALSGGALLAIDGAIRAVGNREEVEPLIPDDAMLVDAGGRVLMPGFVDAHTHLVFAGNRLDEFTMRLTGASYREIAEAGGGILSTVHKTRAASFEDLLAEARKHLGWMAAGGTTTVEAKSGYGLSVEHELRLLEIAASLKGPGIPDIVGTVLAPHAKPLDFEGSAGDFVRLVAIPVLEEAKARGLAEFADAFVEEGFFSPDVLQPYFERAASLGMPLRLHVDQLENAGGAACAARLKAKTADHLEHADSAGIEAMVATGVQPVLLPGSVYGLGKTRYPDARTMIDAGLAVVVATDFNPGSSPTPSMPMALSLACTQMRMTPEEAIVAGTHNAAYSLNRGHDRGSLEPGKRADLVLHDASDYREIPYWFGRQTASRMWIEGHEASV